VQNINPLLHGMMPWWIFSIILKGHWFIFMRRSDPWDSRESYTKINNLGFFRQMTMECYHRIWIRDIGLTFITYLREHLEILTTIFNLEGDNCEGKLKVKLDRARGDETCETWWHKEIEFVIWEIETILGQWTIKEEPCRGRLSRYCLLKWIEEREYV